jgi:hypothetical protein
MPYLKIANAVIPRTALGLVAAAWLAGKGLAADGGIPSPAVGPVQLQLPTEWVHGLGQPADIGRTAVVVHPAGGGAVSLPVVADTSLWKESKNAGGSGTSILLRDNRFAQGLIRIDPLAADLSAAFTASFHFKVAGVERKGMPAKFSLHRVLTDWSEDATWFSPQPDQGSAWNGLKAGTDYDAAPLAEWQTPALSDNQVVEIEGLDRAVKAWRSGEWPNYGFLILLNGKALQCSFPSREKFEDPHAIQLGGENSGALVLAPNAGVLSNVLLKPDDLLDASLRLDVRKASRPAKGSPADVSIEVLRALRPIADHPLVAGTDFDAKPIATCIVTSQKADSTIAIPGLADALRRIAAGEWKNDGLIVRLTTDAAPALSVAGPGDARNAPTFAVTLKPADHAVLFSNDIMPRPGIYTTFRNGHLYYGQDRLRLWGAVGSPHADRLIKMGFNAERIWDPRVNLSKTAPGFYDEASIKRGEPLTYVKGDGSLIDRWDQHFADDKAHGIFIMLAALQNGMPVPPLAADDSFIAPGHDPGSDAFDWEAWKKAVLTRGAEPMLAKIAVIDDRLLSIRKRAAKNLLRHLNQYTGKPLGEDEAVAVYEVFNENGFAKVVLEGESEKWPPFFQDELRRKWNTWLKSRYGDDAALAAAWGSVGSGESLAAAGQGTVMPGPALANRASFPAARASDFVRFVIETDHRFQEEFRAYCRTLAPSGVGVNVAPFSFDTQYRPQLAWNYTNSLADVNCFGMYFWELTSSLTRPPSAYVIDSGTTEGAATILYETNCGRPDPYRAEYPIKCAALADWQDWDGVFWHYWSPNDQPDESYLTTPMAPPAKSFYWTAVQHQNDPVMCSAMSIAGRIFLNHDIHPARNPAIFDVGAKALFGYDHYNGIGVAQQTFTRGAKIHYDPDKPADVTLDGAAPPEPQRITGAVAGGEEVLWDWPNGRLIIDAPTAKAYVGRVSGPFKFKDGIVLGEVNTPFVSFAMASGDGKPLTGPDASKKIYVTAVADARNTDFKFNYDVKGGPVEQAAAVSNRGRAPVIVDKVTCTVWLPTNLDGTFTQYDFALRSAATQLLSNTNRFSQTGATPYMSVLSIDRRGGPATVPATAPVASVIAGNPEDHPAAPTTGQTAPAHAGPWNPVPVLSWGLDYSDAQRALRDSNLVYISLSKQDLSDTPAKTITVSDARLASLWNAPADLEISFTGDRMSSITATFKQPPPFADAVADFQKQFGAPVVKQSGTQFERSLARWDKIDQVVSINMTESQGILKIVFVKR